MTALIDKGILPHEAQASSTSGSVLPPELEEIIFELAFLENAGSAGTRFMLVAHRVHIWIAALRYSIVQKMNRLYIPDTSNIIRRRNASEPNLSYYGGYVKHLMLGADMPSEEIRRFLKGCPNAVDLVLWSRHPIKDVLDILQTRAVELQRLCTNLSSLNKWDLVGPAFKCVTHLDITAFFSKEWADWKVLTTLPKLTHIAMNEITDIKIIQNLLTEGKHLQILLLIENFKSWEWTSVIQDHRLVMMKIERYVAEEWVSAIRGEKGSDFWVVAERISAIKRSSRSKGLHRFWFSQYKWEEELQALMNSEIEFEVESISSI